VVQLEKFSIDFRSQGAVMMLGVQTFDYVVKDEDGELIDTYTSTDEPPMKGDILDLSSLPHWEAAEVLGVTMMLTDRDNTVILKVRPAAVSRQ
jgi:hypothetical protein